jgi:hypothetical protein
MEKVSGKLGDPSRWNWKGDIDPVRSLKTTLVQLSRYLAYAYQRKGDIQKEIQIGEQIVKKST